MSPLRCPGGHPAELVTGRTIYPHRSDLFHKQFWACLPCNAYVGCHPGTSNPLGYLLANAELRSLRSQAHAAFDPLWSSARMRRKDAYAWLAEKTGIPGKRCHIGMMNADECRKVLAVKPMIEELTK